MLKDLELRSYFLKNFIFGVEDSLVSTVGLLSGIVVGGVEQATVILTGVVLIFVEALSMGVGSFLSESHGQEYKAKSKVDAKPVIIGGIIMFISYFIAGFIPLAPYLIFPISQAFIFSVALSLITLFFLGAWSAKVSRISLFKMGMRMMIIGGLAILVGIAASNLVQAL
ncbi:MAG: VIT1/CCC1 transporter family protein [bacterium]|nr:VIT1/CCC1 transporter family protein [bacterium]